MQVCYAQGGSHRMLCLSFAHYSFIQIFPWNCWHIMTIKGPARLVHCKGKGGVYNPKLKFMGHFYGGSVTIKITLFRQVLNTKNITTVKLILKQTPHIYYNERDLLWGTPLKTPTTHYYSPSNLLHWAQSRKATGSGLFYHLWYDLTQVWSTPPALPT